MLRMEEERLLALPAPWARPRTREAAMGEKDDDSGDAEWCVCTLLTFALALPLLFVAADGGDGWDESTAPAPVLLLAVLCLCVTGEEVKGPPVVLDAAAAFGLDGVSSQLGSPSGLANTQQQ